MIATLKNGRVYRRFRTNGKTVLLREIRRDDVDKLLRFVNGLVDDKRRGRFRDIFTGFEQTISRSEEINWVESQMVQLGTGRMVSVLAEVDEKIVANGDIRRGDYDETRHHGRIGLTVLAAFRGMGIGREMVRVLLHEAKRTRLKNVEVEFLSTNRAAYRTYQKAGFSEVGRIPGKVRRNGKLIDSMIMARRV